jgi:hypothetical protein
MTLYIVTRQDLGDARELCLTDRRKHGLEFLYIVIPTCVGYILSVFLSVRESKIRLRLSRATVSAEERSDEDLHLSCILARHGPGLA